jgi:F0F1-type ATP synthase assembly protein I
MQFMKNQLIATVVGALILFIWQFLSWSLLNVHGAETQYTPNQDKIMEVLSANLEEGEYFIPGVPPGSTAEEEQAAMEAAIGKPWAKVSYHPEMKMNMGLNLTRGLVIDLVSIWLLVWLLMQFADLTFAKTVMASLAVGTIAYFTIPYLNHIWFEGSTIGYLIDNIVQWGLIGVWLGWFLNRK